MLKYLTCSFIVIVYNSTFSCCRRWEHTWWLRIVLNCGAFNKAYFKNIENINCCFHHLCSCTNNTRYKEPHRKFIVNFSWFISYHIHFISLYHFTYVYLLEVNLLDSLYTNYQYLKVMMTFRASFRFELNVHSFENSSSDWQLEFHWQRLRYVPQDIDFLNFHM